MLSLQKCSKTDNYWERPLTKTSRPMPNTHPVRPGPGPRKRFVFQMFSKNDIHQQNHESVFVKIYPRACHESDLWLGNGAHVRERFCLRRVQSSCQIINFNLSLDECSKRKVFKPACFVQACACKQNTLAKRTHVSTNLAALFVCIFS